MHKMPELVKLGKELGERGLVIVGINFDQSEDKMRAAIEQQQLGWPQVYANAAAKNDENLWRDAAGSKGCRASWSSTARASCAGTSIRRSSGNWSSRCSTSAKLPVRPEIGRAS